MKVYNLEIDSALVPKVIFDVRELGFIIYPSKNNESLITLNQEKNKLGIIFFQDNIDFEKETVDSITIKLIKFINLIFQDYRSIEWLKFNKELSKVSPENFIEVNNLDFFIENLTETNINNIKGLYKIDLNDFNYNFSWPYTIKIDFRLLLVNYFNLDNKDTLKIKIDFFGFQSSLKLLIGRFYDNDNLEKSLQFMLLEQIISESVTNEKTKRKCNLCDKEIEVNKGVKIKIREFVENFTLVLMDESSKELIVKSLINLSSIRNKFFHNGNHYSRVEFDDFVTGKYGNAYTLNQEVADKNPRAIAPMIFRTLIQTVLIEELKNKVII